MFNMTMIALFGLLKTLHKQHALLVGLINRRRVVPIVQTGGWIRAAVSHQLVPGDVVVVQRGKATVDMVLLRGSCLVEESMLSGEVCCVVLRCAALCCAVLCGVVRRCAVLCCAVLVVRRNACCQSRPIPAGKQPDHTEQLIVAHVASPIERLCVL